MPDAPFHSAEFREAQATACLEAAATHRVQLLAVATALAGSADGGMDLFQQTCLNCHDAIQRRGFAGTEYRGYLLRAIKRLHQREMQLLYLARPLLTEHLATSAKYEQNKALRRMGNPDDPDARDHLADQLSAEVASKFPELRMALHLHLNGHSYQQIADLTTGRDQSWIRRQLVQVKNHLRQTFGRAWANLDSE